MTLRPRPQPLLSLPDDVLSNIVLNVARLPGAARHLLRLSSSCKVRVVHAAPSLNHAASHLQFRFAEYCQC